MVFVMTVTLWSLVLQVRTAAGALLIAGPRFDAATLNGVVCVMLIALAVVLIVEGVRAVQAAARPQMARA
jgi:carbon starvation protein